MKKYKREIIGIISAIGIFAISYFLQKEVIAVVMTIVIAKELIKLKK